VFPNKKSYLISCPILAIAQLSIAASLLKAISAAGRCQLTEAIIYDAVIKTASITVCRKLEKIAFIICYKHNLNNANALLF